MRSTLSKADGDGDAPLSGQDRPLGGTVLDIDPGYPATERGATRWFSATAARSNPTRPAPQSGRYVVFRTYRRRKHTCRVVVRSDSVESQGPELRYGFNYNKQSHRVNCRQIVTDGG